MTRFYSAVNIAGQSVYDRYAIIRGVFRRIDDAIETMHDQWGLIAIRILKNFLLNLGLFRVFIGINPASSTKVSRTKGQEIRSGVHEAVLSLVKDMAVYDITQ